MSVLEVGGRGPSEEQRNLLKLLVKNNEKMEKG